MTVQQYQHLLHIMELIDGVESLVTTLPRVSGKGRKMARLQANMVQAIEDDLEQLRSTLLQLV